MIRRRIQSKIVVLALVGLAVSACAAAEDYVSPLAVVADDVGARLYVAGFTAKQVAVFDVAAGEVVKTVGVPERPTGLALSPDGALLFVTGAAAAGHVHLVDLSSGEVCGAVACGHTPMAPVLSPDGTTLYVCNRFDNDVLVVDVAAKAEVARIPVVREPVAAAMTPDGKLLFVANHLPGGTADADYVAAVVSVIDAATNTVAATIRLANGSTGLRGLCMSPDGAYVYVTHLLGRYQLPTTQLERGWMNTNALTVIDARERALVNTVLLDDVDLGAANPWGVACTADGALICVTHAGTHEVSVIDRAGLHEKLAKVAAGEGVSEVSQTSEDVPNDLAFLVDLRRRIPLAGIGPRGLAVVGSTLYAAEYFTDSLGVVDIDPAARPKARMIRLAPETAMSALRTGEMFFNNASLCFQHWQSCASCHPDVRADGLNWDLLNDGIGNPKNTKSLVLSHQTPPVMITGVRDRAEIAVRAGIKYIQFAVRPEEDAEAIDEYLKSLKPQPSPHLVDGALNPAAERGRAIFDEAGCATCHCGALYTDMIKYNLGTGKDREADWEFDTPTLLEVWRTAPYLHDGRAATLEELLTTHNPEDRHGVTSGLSKEQISDLAEFVRSL